jgi:hypothetical protein
MGALEILMLPQGDNMQILPQNLSTCMKHLYIGHFQTKEVHLIMPM